MTARGSCGRPFLVNDEARTAAVVANGDWLARAETAIESNHAADSELASHGVLGPRTLSALRRSSALDVTWPLLETLLASNETHSAAAPTFSARAAG